MPSHFWLPACSAAGVVLVIAAAPLARARARADLPVAAQAFLASLTPAQRAKAVFAFDADERLVWHYVPKERRGMALGEMDEKQRTAAKELLRVALSPAGYRKVETIRALEMVLQELENDAAGTVRNPDRYYLTIFGEPSAQGAWAVRYEGHHLSLHWTILNGRVIASTPQFLGANPARVGQRSAATGPRESTRPLAIEEDLGRALARSLTAEQRAQAMIAGEVPGDILTAARRRAEALEDVGIPFAALNPEQRGLLLSLIRAHAAVQTATVVERRLEAIRKAGLNTIRFAWLGGLEPGQGHYYRLQGKTFVIEYDNTQNHANHVHTVWRDFRGDFGEDALAEHYRQFPPGTAGGQEHGHDHP